MAEPTTTRELAAAVEEVTKRAQLIVRDEIELAKAEVTTKVTKLAKGVAVGAAAGIFLVAALIYGLHSLSWGFYSLFFDDMAGPWLGYLITTLLLVLLAAIAGFLAYKFVKGGAPPTPQMAIEEAQKVRATVDEARSSDKRLQP
jgi:tetrahydromethanopterin S-methyltransferase subunit F